jgi:hypothetical protein
MAIFELKIIIFNQPISFNLRIISAICWSAFSGLSGQAAAPL